MIVLDASVALAAITGHAPARQAIALDRLIAPAHIDVEIAHALRGLVLGNKVSAAAAADAIALWQSLAVDRLPIGPLLDRVWQLRENLTAYDAAYVALAERHSVPLVTGDRALANAPGVRCQIHLIAA